MVKAADYLEQAAGLTQEGRAQHPIQAHVGDFARNLKQMLVGGTGGGEQLKTGFLTNPVTSLIMPGVPEASSDFMQEVASIPSKIGEFAKGKVGSLVMKLTGTSPERIAELSQVEQKVANAHAAVIAAENNAKTAAKAAFPQISTPVELPPKYATGGWHEGHFVTQDELEPVKIPFKQAQEQYSQLSLDARNAYRARLRGEATGFDEANILKQKDQIDAAMQTAAKADGKLPELQQARTQFKRYMDDFHNRGSAVEPLLEMKPDQTHKIATHFLNPDKSARTIEILKQYGGDVQSIQDLLARGSTPLKIDVAEAAKWRQLGDQYGERRLQESIDQATYNRLPSSAEARLPAWAMRKETKIPGVPEAISPDIPTRTIIKKLLQSDIAKKAVRP